MADENLPLAEDDEYDEEADSDFNVQPSEDGSDASSDDDAAQDAAQDKSAKKLSQNADRPLIEELDSGDEVTIKERQKSKKKQKRRKDGFASSDEEKREGWRAKTRSMRVQEKEEKQKKKLASRNESTIDVDRIWEEMNRPGPLPPLRIEGEEFQMDRQEPMIENTAGKQKSLTDYPPEEMITIKRQFKFAGEVHVEERIVPKSSAEAQLWLSQQEGKASTEEADTNQKQRPLRKISRFDPNYSNHAAFRNYAIKAQPEAFKGPKLNVVEKSKMDWASHVDTEGLKEELDVHAKAKDAYLNRMDFLGQVEQRKEEEARLARQRGG